jgi:hypothetical protein
LFILFNKIFIIESSALIWIVIVHQAKVLENMSGLNRPVYTSEESPPTYTIRLPWRNKEGIDTELTLVFTNRQDLMEYNRDLNRIRDKNNENFTNASKMSMSEYNMKVQFWLQTCKIFRLEWGDAMVPHDVKWCCNDAEDYVGIQRSIFECNDPKTIIYCNAPKKRVTVESMHVFIKENKE